MSSDPPKCCCEKWKSYITSELRGMMIEHHWTSFIHNCLIEGIYNASLLEFVCGIKMDELPIEIRNVISKDECDITLRLKELHDENATGNHYTKTRVRKRNIIKRAKDSLKK